MKLYMTKTLRNNINDLIEHSVYDSVFESFVETSTRREIERLFLGGICDEIWVSVRDFIGEQFSAK